MNYIYLLFFFLLTYNSLQAQTIQAGRPTQAYGTATLPKGLAQLETGTSIDIQDSLLIWNLSQTTLRYGIFKNFDAYTTINLSQNTIANNLANYSSLFSVGLRYRLINKKIKLTYWGSANIPLYPNKVTTTHILAMGHSVGKKVAFGYSLAYNYDFGRLTELQYYGNLQGSFLVNVALMKKLSCFFGFTTNWDSGKNRLLFLYDAGITYLIKDNLQVDLFWGHGINHKRGIYGLGISWLIKNKPTTH